MTSSIGRRTREKTRSGRNSVHSPEIPDRKRISDISGIPLGTQTTNSTAHTCSNSRDRQLHTTQSTHALSRQTITRNTKYTCTIKTDNYTQHKVHRHYQDR